MFPFPHQFLWQILEGSHWPESAPKLTGFLKDTSALFTCLLSIIFHIVCLILTEQFLLCLDFISNTGSSFSFLFPFLLPFPTSSIFSLFTQEVDLCPSSSSLFLSVLRLSPPHLWVSNSSRHACKIGCILTRALWPPLFPEGALAVEFNTQVH